MKTTKIKAIMVSAMLATSALTGSAQLSNAAKMAAANEERNAAVFNVSANPDIPMSVDFAGQRISLDRIDMFERMDRELTSLIYGHTSTLLCIKRANRYFAALEAILKQQNVPLDFLYLACTESTMDYAAYSSSHAAGLWQLLAATGRQYGLEVNDEVDERYDPERSTVAACKYLKDAYSKYRDWPTVAASYNAGMGRISSELGKQGQKSSFDLWLNQETSRYVFRILAFKVLMENPKRYGFRLRRAQLYQPVRYNIVEVNGGVASWIDWAKSHGCTYAQLREANPWIRASKLTNSSGRTYRVRVPVSDELYRSKRKFTTYNKNWTID